MKGYKIVEVAKILYEQGYIVSDSISAIKLRIKEAYN